MSSASAYTHILWWVVLVLLAASGYALFILSKIRYIDTKKHFIQHLKQCKTKQALVKKVAPFIHKNRQLTRLIYRLEECDEKGFRGIKQKIIQHFYP